MYKSKFGLIGDEYDMVINTLLDKPVLICGGYEVGGPVILVNGVLKSQQSCHSNDQIHLHIDNICLSWWCLFGIISLSVTNIHTRNPDWQSKITLNVNCWDTSDLSTPDSDYAIFVEEIK